jgi:hypothetical protein
MEKGGVSGRKKVTQVNDSLILEKESVCIYIHFVDSENPPPFLNNHREYG